jgi:hypothetical protein
MTGLIAYLGRNRARVRACGTCGSVRAVRKLGHYAGFCHDCLDRSRIDADDELGGES